MPFPVSLPPYHACTIDEARLTQGMDTGVPDWLTMTVFGAAVSTLVISVSMLGGRDMVGRSKPSPSQSAYKVNKCKKSA